jgi:hypothetical protein
VLITVKDLQKKHEDTEKYEEYVHINDKEEQGSTESARAGVKVAGHKNFSMQEIAGKNPMFLYPTFVGKIIFEGFILQNIFYIT